MRHAQKSNGTAEEPIEILSNKLNSLSVRLIQGTDQTILLLLAVKASTANENSYNVNF